MPINRYYTACRLNKGDTVSLIDQERHHLITVTRTAIGERVEIVNGQNQWAHASLVSFDKKEALLHLDDVFLAPAPKHNIILCQALLRSNKLDFIVEKGCELGMTALWLFPAEKGEKIQLSDSQQKRLESLAISAMKQCGRFDLPTITLKPPLSKWPPLPSPCSAFYGDTSPNAPCIKKEWLEKDLFLFIGPESGFSKDEIVSLQNLGARGIKLHTNTLRTETASLAGLSVIDYLCNCFDDDHIGRPRGPKRGTGGDDHDVIS